MRLAVNRAHAVLSQDLTRTPTVADIAERLFLSSSTVRNYLSAAIGKTGTRNRTEAALLARHNGWL
jgi:DNA-binding NarL/FixJ family response regulator